MAAYLFTRAILAGEPIQVFNEGRMARDFTYIDDIVAGIIAAADRPAASGEHRIYNLGNHRPEQLLDFIGVLERLLGRTATKRLLPMQLGDVPASYADIETARRDLGFEPKATIETGLAAFVEWYKQYHGAELIGTERVSLFPCILASGSVRKMERGFAVIGLGYVGLPVALALAKAIRPGDRVRHFVAPHRRVAQCARCHRRGCRSRAAREQSDPVERSRCARSGEFFRCHGADADRLGAPPGSVAARKRLRLDRSAAAARFGRRIRIDRISRADPRISADRCWRSPPVSGRVSISSSAIRRSGSIPATASIASRRS